MTATPATRRRSLRAYLLSLCALGLAACASGPYDAKVRVRGGDGLNPKLDGTATSVNVRVLQLTEKGKAWFDESGTDVLVEGDADSLRNHPEVLAYRETQVYVATEGEIAVVVQPEAKFVGVVALFNDLVNDKWKLLVPVDELDDETVAFDGFAISVATEDQ